jgi:ABC-2 type transport system ATP-binding protein
VQHGLVANGHLIAQMHRKADIGVDDGALLDVGAAADVQLRKYSKGMLQRIGIAQALINAPELVVLDEPMSGLDPLGRKEIRDLIFELKHQGRTVFFSSHILQDVEQICDRVAILVRGEVKRTGPINTLLEDGDGGVEVLVAGLPAETAARLGSGVSLREGHRYVVASVEVDAFLRAALEVGGSIRSVTPQRRSLEAIFVEEAQRA